MQRLIQRGGAARAWACPPGMPALIHGLLMQRGVASLEEAEAFLHPSADQLIDPMKLSGMPEAVERILRARGVYEDVCVFGDYDVDGVSASSLLSMFLREMGMRVSVYIPSRHEEGYGLNERAIIEIAKTASLLITVDCGISCLHEVELAKSLGMDVIVTDHHRPGDLVPDCTVINPLLGDYPFPSLCGAGVAFKLILALAAGLEKEQGMCSVPPGWGMAGKYVDLAALATVADIVPLISENRVIVSLGLKMINENPRPGVAALIHAAGLDGKTISAGNIGFQLAPRLNASGRLGDARRAMALLTSDNGTEAAPIADELEQENTARRACEQQIVEEALEKMKQYDLLRHRIIVIVGEGWNSGVIGLAASRLVTKYFYPVILLAEKDGVCTGSCRSIPGVDIFAALSSCADLMTRFGGHKQAAGLTIDRDKVEQLIERLDEYIWENVSREEYIPQMEYDLRLPLNEVSEEAVRQMELMQPTGFGNPSPVLLSEVIVESARAVGKEGAHLQMKLSDGFNELPAICFGEGPRAGELAGEERKMLHAPGLNVWRDRVSVQCEVKNVLESGPETVFERFEEKYIRYLRTYLTEVLYNIKLHSTDFMVKSVSEAQISAWLKRSPQGTAIAVSSLEGMKSLRRFLKKEGLTGHADARIGRWTEDARAFNTVFLCPAGECPVRYERVILWDAPKEAFASLPEGELFRPAVRTETGWRHELPSVDRLREMFIAARSLTKGGALLRTSASDIEQELARAAGGGWVEAMASLAALRSMQLIGPERERLYLMPPRKADPLDDITYQKIRLLRDDAKGKG
ncbi:MAG: single-stranded-DNA-specific exonuclease RecJ [Clostridia bacterium]|nr:single-stranded-DNA-specific exonuclease RecJ [Clostridia bacterium]